MKKLVYALLCLSLASCGGGGGSDGLLSLLPIICIEYARLANQREKYNDMNGDIPPIISMIGARTRPEPLVIMPIEAITAKLANINHQNTRSLLLLHLMEFCGTTISVNILKS